jgi:hypothetical protein
MRREREKYRDIHGKREKEGDTKRDINIKINIY